MKTLFSLLFILVFSYFSTGQSVGIKGFGFTLGPEYGNRFTKNKNDNQVTPYPGYKVGYQKMNDSLDKLDGFRAGFDFGLNAFFTTYSKVYFSIGIGYRNTGYRRHFESLKYKDSIQYMGKIDVFSDNGPKDITFNFRYHYLELPVMVHFSLNSREDQYDETNKFITIGLSPNWLLKNNYNARLFGFSIEEQVNFKGNEIFYTNRVFNCNVLLGGRFQTALNEDFRFNITPVISFPLLSQTVNEDATFVRPYSIMVNAGLSYKIE